MGYICGMFQYIEVHIKVYIVHKKFYHSLMFHLKVQLKIHFILNRNILRLSVGFILIFICMFTYLIMERIVSIFSQYFMNRL